jgi:DNA transformation protein
MPTTAAFLDYVVELFAPWSAVTVKRMFGGAGIYRDGRMVGLVADDQIYLKVNADTRGAFESAGSHPFVFESKNGQGTTMSYLSLPPEALDDSDTLREWADRAWSAAAAAKPPAKPAVKRGISRAEMADLPLKPGGKPPKRVKKR